MATTYVLAADTVRARFFRCSNRRGPLTEVQSLAHPESRLKERDLASDRPGRSFDSGGQGRHAMGQRVEPGRHEAMRFAGEVCDALTAARQTGAFDKLYVVAAPAFLGMLRERMDGATRRMLAGEVDKNLATRDTDEIRQHLPDYL